MCTWDQFDESYIENEEHENFSLMTSTYFNVQLENTTNENDEDMIFSSLSCDEFVFTFRWLLGNI